LEDSVSLGQFCFSRNNFERKKSVNDLKKSISNDTKSLLKSSFLQWDVSFQGPTTAARLEGSFFISFQMP